MGPRASSTVTIARSDSAPDLHARLVEDVRKGLSASPKDLPPKYFYDARGSELFERITRLPEYYPSAAETEILEENAGAILRHVGPSELVEFGSGSSRKTRLLIEAMRRVGGDRYVPIDVSEDALRGAVDALAQDNPWLEIHGIVGDFHQELDFPPRIGRRLVAFLGSTIGNMEPDERGRLLCGVRRMLQRDDAFLVGLDLVKDEATLVAAYDDSEGVTSEFNKNLLNVLNRELDGDLPVDAFEHVAFWDAANARIDIRLRATRPVRARLRAIDLDVTFDEGEELHTEYSSKFTPETAERELGEAGLRLERWLTDRAGRFALALARPS